MVHVWSTATAIADAEAKAATVNGDGRAEFFFQNTGVESVVATGLELDRFGAVTKAAQQVLGVGFDDPSQPPEIFGVQGGWGEFTEGQAMQFGFALSAADGSTLLFSLNERETYSVEGEEFDYEPYHESWLTTRYLTAYRLGDTLAGENGLVPYADYAFTAQGNAQHDRSEQLIEIYDPDWDEYYEEEVVWSGTLSNTIVDASALTFDNGDLLVSWRLDSKADGDNPFTGSYHTASSSIAYQFVDLEAPGQPAAVVLDDTPVGNSVVVDRPGGRLGVLWINQAFDSSLRIDLAQVASDGTIERSFKNVISASAFGGASTIVDPTVITAAAREDGTLTALLSANGRAFVMSFDRGLHHVGAAVEVAGVRWSGRMPEHVADAKIVQLAGGGFVLGLSLESDGAPGGADHRLLIQQYDDNGALVDRPIRIGADGSWFNLADMGDGRLNLAWTDGGKTWSEVLDTRAAGLALTGLGATDTLIGTALADILDGGSGNDKLAGGAGNDRLHGGDGNDLLVGGEGADRLSGGEGRDVARYDKASMVDLLDRSLNAGEAQGDILSSIEHLRGSFQNDIFYGGNAADTLEGRDGADVLVGRAGNDILIGGAGADTLEGGAGADQFRFTSPFDGGDTVADFESGADKIGIEGSRFGGIAAINLVASATPVPASATAAFLFNTATGVLSFDADGSGAGAPVQLATLTGVTQLGSSDFVLI